MDEVILPPGPLDYLLSGCLAAACVVALTASLSALTSLEAGRATGTFNRVEHRVLTDAEWEGIDAPAYTTLPCRWEDGPGPCLWDGTTRGSRTGLSYIVNEDGSHLAVTP